jgi:hypothetical protein
LLYRIDLSNIFKNNDTKSKLIKFYKIDITIKRALKVQAVKNTKLKMFCYVDQKCS